jgi:hypothetical protein
VLVGSVPILRTSGDNDPELEPVQSLRHYLYCDACGSFDLDPWEAVEPAPLERHRTRLMAVARYSLPFVVVPAWHAAWHAAGWAPTLSVLLFVAMGIAFMQVLRSLPLKTLRKSEEFRAQRHFLLGASRWLVLLMLAEGLSWLLPAGWVALGGVLVVAGALAWRAALAAHEETLGVRCRQCAATYGFRTPFFADLDANPRGLTEADVPRPLSRLEYREGRYLGPAPAEPQSRLPP